MGRLRPLILNENFAQIRNEKLGIRNEGGGFAEIDDEVAAVLAFVISHTTYLAAQDDETGRCQNVCDGRFPSYRQPSPRGEGAPKGRIGHRRYERQMRKAEKCAAYVWKRETQTANDNDLISVSLKIIRAPSSGRGRRAKRGGVGFPECGSSVSRGQPPPLRGTSFQRKEGEKRGCMYRHRYS